MQVILKECKEQLNHLRAAVVLAVILIYLNLAALYESFIQPPIIIMVTMPLEFTGVITALGLIGNNFSLFIMIGVILLLGIVGKMSV
jgi:HAE1 family hydrophobic/amphiphilic exporter-1